jgi:hypothetical protein
MVLGNSFRRCWLLALLAMALLIAPAAAQNPAGTGPVTPNRRGPMAGARWWVTDQIPGDRSPFRRTQHTAPVEPPRMATLGSPRPDEHPLMPALRWAYDGLGNIEKLQDYSATMVKRERINGKVGEPEYMFVKIRHQPFSVYIYFLGPAELKGREVIYVQGSHSGNLLAHATGLQGKLLGVLELAPTGLVAMRGNRYPLTEIGILNMVRRLVEVGEEDIKYGECEVKFFKGAKINNRVCTCIQVVHPVPRRNFLFHLARIFVDDELNMPIRYESYDWPETAGGAPRLLEEYTYLNLKLNNGFTDADFDVRNPNYKFP